MQLIGTNNGACDLSVIATILIDVFNLPPGGVEVKGWSLEGALAVTQRQEMAKSSGHKVLCLS